MPDWKKNLREGLQAGLAGFAEGLSESEKVKLDLQKEIFKEQLKRRMFPEAHELTKAKIGAYEALAEKRRGLSGEVSKEVKEKKLTKSEIKDTQKILMRNFLGLEMQKARKEETLWQKATPARSKFKILNEALVKRRKDSKYFKKNALQINTLFKDIGLTMNDFRAFVRENYGELEEKIFPTERRLEMFRR